MKGIRIARIADLCLEPTHTAAQDQQANQSRYEAFERHFRLVEAICSSNQSIDLGVQRFRLIVISCPALHVGRATKGAKNP
jgi:hypothetical protein